MEFKCWFARICGSQEICSHQTDLTACTRYNQMYLQTVKAGIPGMLPINHQLEKPKNPDSLDYCVYTKLMSLDLEKLVEDGKSIVIESSKSGNGKTTWAQRLLLKYLTKNLEKSDVGYFLDLPQVFHEVKESISSGERLPYDDIFKNVKLLVIDNVGHRAYSSYEKEWLLRVLSLRSLKGLSTIYTMTLSKQSSLTDMIGERLFSRIYNGSTHFVFFENDKRSWVQKSF